MRVLGIDPGLAEVGFGVIERPEGEPEPHHLADGVIQTPAGLPDARRLETIYNRLREIIAQFRPDAVAIEEIYFAKNVKTAVAVAQARGVAVLATALTGVSLHEYSPPQIKLALAGHGKGTKHQVQMMVRSVLGMESPPQSDHAADALAAAICHLHTINSARAKAMAALQRLSVSPPSTGPPRAGDKRRGSLPGQPRTPSIRNRSNKELLEQAVARRIRKKRHQKKSGT